MAYQNIGTPRFYVSVLQWLKSLEKISIGNIYEIGATSQEALSLLDLNPTHTKVSNAAFDGDYEVVQYSIDDPIANYTYENQGFVMLLNHNFKSAGASVKIKEEDGNSCGTPNNDTAINAGISSSWATPNYDGWSLWTFDDISDLSTEETLKFVMTNADDSGTFGSIPLKLGSFLLGNYYDMSPPNLNLTMKREYGGIKTIETIKGTSLSNSFYRGSPSWGDVGAWELHSGTP